MNPSSTDNIAAAAPSQKVPLSVCIVSNVLDDTLGKIVTVCAAYFDEILIGYNGDQEQTETVWSAAGQASIVPVAWEGYSATKNKLAEQAHNNWILSLDGDEVPDTTLLKAMAGLSLKEMPVNRIFIFKRISFFEGQRVEHGAWGRDQVIRLYNRNHTCWNNEVVHEALQRNADTELIPLKGLLLHYTADTYDRFLEKNKKYALLSADKYYARGRKSPVWKQWFSPAFTFMKEYVFQGGFRDGRAGFKVAKINALYTKWKYSYLREKYKSRA